MDGIVNIYKEKGYTSRDAVTVLSGILKQKKIGHIGTLDPLAEGVLPMCVGRATKLSDFLSDGRKEYIAVLKLGYETDTEDVTGSVIKEVELRDEWYLKNITSENIKRVLDSFKGKLMQIPPMYSAKKLRGKRLYELARQGIEVKREPCEIEIYDIFLERIDLPNREISIRVSCSKGTYIRTLCKDIGRKLDTLATMKELTRTKVGNFLISSSYRLSEIEILNSNNKIDEFLVSPEAVLKDLKEIRVSPKFNKLLINGGILSGKYFLDCDLQDMEKYRMYDEKGEFKAVYVYDKQSDSLKVYKMF